MEPGQGEDGPHAVTIERHAARVSGGFVCDLVKRSLEQPRAAIRNQPVSVIRAESAPDAVIDDARALDAPRLQASD